MADKIDQLTLNGTSYDIDLPPDATPIIKQLTIASTTTATIRLEQGLSSITRDRTFYGVDTIQHDVGAQFGTLKTLTIPWSSIGAQSTSTIATEEFVLSNAIPYSGATSNVDLGSHTIAAEKFEFTGADAYITDDQIGNIEFYNNDGNILLNSDGDIHLNPNGFAYYGGNVIATRNELSYITTAPTSSNTTSMLKVVTLPSASASTITFKNGYLYVFY